MRLPLPRLVGELAGTDRDLGDLGITSRLSVTGLSAQECPDEATEFTGNGDLGFVALEPAGQQPGESEMEAVLSFPAQGADVRGLAFLAACQFLADLGRQGVVLGTFGEEPALMGVTATGDGPEVLARTAGMLGADQAQVGHKLAGMSEAVYISQLADGDHGGDQLEAAEGHERLDGGLEAPGFQQSGHGGFDAQDTLVGGVDALEIFFEDGFHGGVGQDQFAQVAHVGLAPVGFALVTVAVAEQEGFEPETGPPLVIDGIGAGAAEIADRFVSRLGNVDGDEFSGTEQAGDGAGVALIGFEGSAGLFGNEGGSGDQAGHSELFQATRNAEAARTGLVSDLQVGARMSFADRGEGSFDRLEGVGDTAKEADLAFGERFGNGDGDRVFMDIKSEVECNSMHGVVVCSHSHDESERIPRPQRGRSCGSAHPGNPR